MTIEDKIKEMFIERGMFDDQAAAVIEIMKAKKRHKSMTYHWHGDVEGYPQSVLDILWTSAKATALEYIDTNIPLAWFRPMFETLTDTVDSSG